MIITVIDGQGGGIGSVVIKKLREVIEQDYVLIAIGTNSIATSRMMKSGANKGASGENAIIRSCKEADIIIGPLSIIMANSMMGELTPRMAEAVSSCKARKILIPLTQENVSVVGVYGEPLPHMVEHAVMLVKEIF